MSMLPSMLVRLPTQGSVYMLVSETLGDDQ